MVRRLRSSLRMGIRALVDLVGFEPTTSSMPWKRAPNCATGPLPKTNNRDQEMDLTHHNFRPPAKDSQTFGPPAPSILRSILRKPGKLVS